MQEVWNYGLEKFFLKTDIKNWITDAVLKYGLESWFAKTAVFLKSNQDVEKLKLKKGTLTIYLYGDI